MTVPRRAPGRPRRPVILFYPGSFMRRGNGSQVRAYDLLRFLNAHFADLTVYSIDGGGAEGWTRDDEAALARAFPDVGLVTDRRSASMLAVCKVKKALVQAMPARASEILRRHVPGISPGYDDLRPAKPLIVANYAESLYLLNGVEGCRCVIETHDVGFFRRMKTAENYPFSMAGIAYFRQESAALRAAAGAVAIAPNEAYFFRQVAPSTQTFYIPRYGAGHPPSVPSAEAAEASRQQDYDHDLLFLGSDNAINERGICEFLEGRSGRGLPFRLAIAGKVSTLPSVRSAAHAAGAELLGFVDDLRDLYARSKAALVPTDGTGLNIKLVEALGHARPVFASAAARAALPPGYEDCVFPLHEEAMTALLSDSCALAHAQNAATGFHDRLSRSGDQEALTAFLGGLAKVSA